MKKKTIEKVIQKKFTEFFNSITDERVRKLVGDNTIVTGGCIASMILKEQVNDFDIYFTNKETTLAVAQYYVKKMKEAAKQQHKDGREIIMEVLDMDNLHAKETQDGRTYGAGSNQEPGRIKIYIKSAGIAGEKGADDYQYFESRPPEEGEDYIESAVQQVVQADETVINTEAKEKYRPVFLSANAITLSDSVQLVIRFYGDPEAIHDNYDYIHCTNYWLSKTGKLTLKQEALESLIAKELVYVGSKYPVCSLIRTRKFIKRGWTINAGQFLKMCFQVSELNLKDLATLEDQLIGVDAAYFGQLIDAMKTAEESHKDDKNDDGSAKKFDINYGYLATIIDKIF